MNVTGLILLGAGYLLGNEPARNQVIHGINQLAGKAVDALNTMGDADVSKTTDDAVSNEE